MWHVGLHAVLGGFYLRSMLPTETKASKRYSMIARALNIATASTIYNKRITSGLIQHNKPAIQLVLFENKIFIDIDLIHRVAAQRLASAAWRLDAVIIIGIGAGLLRYGRVGLHAVLGGFQCFNDFCVRHTNSAHSSQQSLTTGCPTILEKRHFTLHSYLPADRAA